MEKLLTEGDIQHLTPLIPFIKGVNFSEELYYSYSARKKLLEKFLFGNLVLSENKMEKFIYETESTSLFQSILKGIGETTQKIIVGIGVSAGTAVMVPLLNDLISKMMRGAKVNLLLEYKKRIEKRMKSLAESSDEMKKLVLKTMERIRAKMREIGKGKDEVQSAYKYIEEVIDKGAKKYDKIYKDLTRRIEQPGVSAYFKERLSSLRDDFDEVFGERVKKLLALKDAYKNKKIDSETFLQKFYETEVEYMLKMHEINKRLGSALEKKDFDFERSEEERMGIVQRILNRISNKITDTCEKIMDKHRDKPDSWRYRFAKWMKENSGKFFDNLAKNWHIYAIVLGLIILLIVYLAKKDIPYISGFARAIIKVITAPFKLLWRVVTWVLKKLGLIKQEEAKEIENSVSTTEEALGIATA